MSQGTAKKLVGQQASADSNPVVLSSEQEANLIDTAGATTSIDNQLVSALLNEATAVSGKKGMMLLGEDDSGNSEFLRSSAGNLYVRFASTQTVNINDAGGSITVDDGGTTLSIDDGGGSITVDGTVSVGTITTLTTVTTLQTLGAMSNDASALGMQINNNLFQFKTSKIYGY